MSKQYRTKNGTKKILVHGPFQLAVRSLVPSQRLCAMMAHENERIARENEKNEGDATRVRRDVHASGSTRFSLIEPRFLPCNRNCRSTCFPIEWIDPRVRLSQDSTATTPARTKLVPDVWANSRVPSSYQLVPEFHTICPYINDAVWYSWYAGTYQKISWYGIRPLLKATETQTFSREWIFKLLSTRCARVRHLYTYNTYTIRDK